MNEEIDWGKWKKTSAPFMKVLGQYQLRMAIKLCKGPRVLDVGCGDGIITNGLGKHFDEIVGIDESGIQIDYARKNFKHARFIQTSFEGFDDKGGLFDSAISIEVLEHVNDPISFLKGMKALVKKDGYVVIMVPNALALNRRVGELMGIVKDCRMTPHDIEVGHRRMYDLDSLRNDIERSGLEVKDMGGFLLKPLSNTQMQWFLDKGIWENESSKQKLLDAFYEVGKKLPEYSTTLYAQCVIK